jgi:hypothetical protein
VRSVGPRAVGPVQVEPLGDEQHGQAGGVVGAGAGAVHEVQEAPRSPGERRRCAVGRRDAEGVQGTGEEVVLRPGDQPELPCEHDPGLRSVRAGDGGAQQRDERIQELVVLHEVGAQHRGLDGVAPQFLDEPVGHGSVPRGGGAAPELGAE